MNKIVSINDLSIAFNTKKVLMHMSFDVYEGEIFGFLGPSGAGKTTTIKALTKQLRVRPNSIELFGKPLEDHNASVYDRLGIMTDSNDVYDALSVYDNLKFFANLKHVDLDQVDQLLKEIGLYEDRKTLAKKLSRGMRQRLILATALIHKPALLFLDEPTAALDPKTTADIHNLFQRINQNGTTIFLTTHSMEEADKLCDRIAFLDNGTIVEMGSSEALKLKYAENEVIVHYNDGTQKRVTKDQQGLQELANETKIINTIHSIEPNLETIFLAVTGRNNYDNA